MLEGDAADGTGLAHGLAEPPPREGLLEVMIDEPRHNPGCDGSTASGSVGGRREGRGKEEGRSSKAATEHAERPLERVAARQTACTGGEHGAPLPQGGAMPHQQLV